MESIKLFEVSSFSALIERPRTNFPLLPIPFLEVPVIGDLLSIPLPGAKVYHRSTAIVSAVIVPTAADLAFGLTFHGDREVVNEIPNPKSPDDFRNSYRKVISQMQLPWDQRGLYDFNQTMTQCFAAQSGDPNAKRLVWPSAYNPSCGGVTFKEIAPDR